MTQLTPANAPGTLRPGDVVVLDDRAFRIAEVHDDDFWGVNPISTRPNAAEIHYENIDAVDVEYLPREHQHEIHNRLMDLALGREVPPEPHGAEDSDVRDAIDGADVDEPGDEDDVGEFKTAREIARESDGGWNPAEKERVEWEDGEGEA